jgi:hypothetical protein
MQIVEYTNEFQVRIDFNHWRKRNTAAVKKIPAAKFDYTDKVWRIPLNQRGNLVLLQNYCKAKYYKVDESPQELGNIAPLPELAVEIPLSHPDGFGFRPYQTQGVARGLELKRFMNGDEQGLGKTLQSIATLYADFLKGEDVFPALVICPASTKINWKREWEMWTDRKAMLLDNKIKSNWPRYYEIGMADVFIVNYESLKKYFVQHMPPKGKLRTSKDIIMDPRVDLLKSVIVDESHRCFTYETKILTNKGWLMIGEIVEKRMQNLLVASMCLSDNSVSFKRIINFWKNEKQGRKIHSVRAGNREIHTTENHKIYVDGRKWKEAVSVRSGESLYVLQERFLDEENWKNNSDLLRKELCIQRSEFQTGSQRKNGQEQKETIASQRVFRMWGKIHTNPARKRSIKAKVLFSKLFCKMENETTRSIGSSTFARKDRKKQSSCYQTNARPGIKINVFGKNERNQSYAFRRSQEVGFRKKERKAFQFQSGERSTNRTSDSLAQSIGIVRRKYRISNNNRFCKRPIQQNSKLLQIGYRNTGNKVVNRSRWAFPQSFQGKSTGRIENESIELVRVEGNSVLESGNIGRPSKSPERDKYVYDLEIADNHNYFANGILVSNCKDTKTQQAKFTLNICKDKERVILLTGTPVVNKPMDLFPQLAIMNRLEHFGGKKGFLERYCEGGRGAANLKELNYLLNKHCFFRREKKDVAKDLPEKQRQTIMCDITTRSIYNKARDEFAKYLKEKGCDDAEVAKKLRGEIMVKMAELKKISAYGKLNEAKEFIHQVIDAGEKLIVFVVHHVIVDELKKEFPDAVTVTGRDNTEQKQNAIDGFQQNPDVKLIICNIKAAGVGITLTASSRVAFIEYPWTYSDCVQCEDRAHRIGQTNNVMCTYFLGQKTIDEQLYAMIQAKRHVGNTITGATDKMEMTMVSNLMELFN